MYPKPIPYETGNLIAGMSSAGMLPVGDDQSLVEQNEKDKLVEKLVKLSEEKALQDEERIKLEIIRREEYLRVSNKETWIKCFVKIAIQEFHIKIEQLKFLEKKEIILLDGMVFEKAEKIQKTWNFVRWPMFFVVVVGWLAMVALDAKWEKYKEYLQARIKSKNAYGEDFFPFDELIEFLNKETDKTFSIAKTLGL